MDEVLDTFRQLIASRPNPEEPHTDKRSEGQELIPAAAAQRLVPSNHMDQARSIFQTSGLRFAQHFLEVARANNEHINPAEGPLGSGTGADQEALTLMSLGLLYREQGDPEPAAHVWQQALDILEALEAPEADQVAAWLTELKQHVRNER